MRDNATCSGDGELQVDSQNHFPTIFKQYSQQTWLPYGFHWYSQCQMWIYLRPNMFKDMKTGRVLTETGGACSSAHRSKVLVIGQCLLCMLHYVACTCQDKFPYMKPIVQSEFHLPVWEFHDRSYCFILFQVYLSFLYLFEFLLSQLHGFFLQESLDTKVPNMSVDLLVLPEIGKQNLQQVLTTHAGIQALTPWV